MKIFHRKTVRARKPVPAYCITFILCGLVLVLCALPGAAPGPARAQSAAMDPDAVLEHLDAAVGWYRHLTNNLDTGAGSPSDLLYLQNARTQALQVLQLAFKSAQEEAALIQKEAAPSTQGAAVPGQDQERVMKAQERVAARVAGYRSRIDALNRAIKTARGKKRKELMDQRDRVQGQLDLDTALQEGISKMAGFMNGNDKTSLAGRINALKASVPELAATSAGPKPAGQQIAKSTQAYSSGLIGQASVLLDQMGDLRVIDALLSETAKLRATAEGLQSPLRNSLKSLLQEGRKLADQPAAEPQPGTGRQTVDTIIARFKQVSSASLPLREEMVVLDQVRTSLLQWRKSIEKEHNAVLRSLVTHVAIILAALLVVLLLSEIWRRATFRYVREVRRRRQVLLLRRFVTAFCMAVVIILGFVSEFSSLATFAGFLTAGIALALQTVILSVAAYFFLIGRYGVRVGDRITVSGVTGDVIDIGLVRMHLLELSGTGVNLYPTGRVVVFSNSVLLQSSPLFKQIPGTAYTWHEAVVGLTPGADRAVLENRLMEAVNSVYLLYRAEIEQQHGTVERIIEAEVSTPEPHGKLHFTDKGLEFVVRYPVGFRRAPEIDDQVMKSLMEVIENESGLRDAVSGPPKLRSAIKG